MKRKPLAGWLAVLATCWGLGCQALPKPTVAGVTPRVTGLDLAGVDLSVDIAVRNPYPVPITAPRFRYAVAVRDTEVVKSESSSAAELPAGGVGTVTSPVRLEYAAAWRALGGIGELKEIPYELKGALVLTALGQPVEVPVSKKGAVPVVRPPQFSGLRAEVTDRSLVRARVLVRAKMENPNGFAITVKGVAYRLMVGEIEAGGLKVSSAKEEIGAGEAVDVQISGEISGASALAQLLKGLGPGRVRIVPSGEIGTPYGTVKL
jgi:LEA14-like dessication related protein